MTEFTVKATIALLVACISLLTANAERPYECQEAADIVFMIDSSQSIREYNPVKGSHDNWILLVNFIADTINKLPTEDGTIRIGIIVFSSKVDTESTIYLDNSLSKTQLYTAIKSLEHLGGNTNTSGALRSMRNNLFNTSRGDRASARNVGVLATDGLSNVDDHLTVTEARIAKMEGVKLFTLGISKFVDADELQEISSDPVSFYNLWTEDFTRLVLTQDQLLGSLCRSRPPPPTPCEDSRGDITFLLDDSGSIQDKNPANSTGNHNWELLLNFVVALIENIGVSSNGTRVAVIRFDNQAQVIFHLDKYNNTNEAKEAVSKLKYRSGFTNTSGALKLLRKEVFSASKGDRPDVRNIGIMITDGVSTVDVNETLPEANLVKNAGIRMFAIGLTNEISSRELTAIASYPTNEHFFNRTHISDVATLLSRLVWSVCNDPCVNGQAEGNEIDGWGTVCERKENTVCGTEGIVVWRAFPGRLLVGHNYARLTHITKVEDCQVACLQDVSCRSVEYVETIKECSVSYYTQIDAPFSFVEDPLVTYYEWYCGGPETTESDDSSPGVTRNVDKNRPNGANLRTTPIGVTLVPVSKANSSRASIVFILLVMAFQ